MLIRKSVSFKEFQGQLHAGYYGPDGPVSLCIHDKVKGWFWATIDIPASEVPEGHVLVNDYGENKGMLQAMLDQGIVEDVGTRIPCSFPPGSDDLGSLTVNLAYSPPTSRCVDVPLCKLLLQVGGRGNPMMKPSLPYWDCPQCGLGVGVDEDGCCATCGATCREVWKHGDELGGGEENPMRLDVEEENMRRVEFAKLSPPEQDFERAQEAIRVRNNRFNALVQRVERLEITVKELSRRVFNLPEGVELADAPFIPAFTTPTQCLEEGKTLQHGLNNDPVTPRPDPPLPQGVEVADAPVESTVEERKALADELDKLPKSPPTSPSSKAFGRLGDALREGRVLQHGLNNDPVTPRPDPPSPQSPSSAVEEGKVFKGGRNLGPSVPRPSTKPKPMQGPSELRDLIDTPVQLGILNPRGHGDVSDVADEKEEDQ